MKVLATNVVYCERCHTLWEVEPEKDNKKIYGYLYLRIRCPKCNHEIVLS